MFLLLAKDSLQERTLSMTLRLGGHEVRVVNDELEAINLIKSVPLNVCGVVLGHGGCQESLSEKFDMFCSSQVVTPIYLVGMTSEDLNRFYLKHGVFSNLNLSACNSDALLGSVKCERCCGGNEQPWKLVL